VAYEVREAVWGARSGASRNLGNDVRASDAGSSTGADAVPARLVRDRDGIYGAEFDARVDHQGIEQLRIAPRSLGHGTARQTSRDSGDFGSTPH
jgi:hypothetical protein